MCPGRHCLPQYSYIPMRMYGLYRWAAGSIKAARMSGSEGSFNGMDRSDKEPSTVLFDIF